jgi:rSAM/selenodomain-associated transferase 2
MQPVSIVVPALNEAAALAATLAPWSGRDGVELIVVDGGSTDATPTVAARYARVVQAAPGRARQMNAGAAVATGAALLFLHADTRLPEDAVAAVRTALADPAVVGGAFRLSIEPSTPALRLVAAGANLRARWLGLSYGDQALFVRRTVFDALGGFPEVPLMEDLIFVRRLARYGRVRLLPQTVATSSRRWQREGVLTVTLRNQLLVTLWACGVRPERLARWYRPVR